MSAAEQEAPGPPPRRRRRDADRNRRALLRAASEAFAEQGVTAGVDQISRRAGVGPATLYRHFPTKAALVDAVLEERVEALSRLVREAGEARDAGDAVRRLVHDIADVQVNDRSFRDLLSWRDASGGADVAAIAELGRLLAEIVDRARDAGGLRPEVTVNDLMLLLIALDGVSGSAGSMSVDALHRLVDLLVDGLSGRTTPLQGSPLEFAELRAVARARGA